MEIQSHELWLLLKEKAKEKDAGNAPAYETAVAEVCQYGVELSKTIIKIFQTYTLHDETHICNVMTKMLELLGDLKSELTRDECAILVMAACCHDIGMSVTDEEINYLSGCPDCMQIYLDQNPSDYSAAYKDGLNKAPNITMEILQHYIRANHHVRVKEQLQLIEWPEVLGCSIGVDELSAVCQSHGEDAETISHLQNFSHELDLHLCAVLLRLSDILDFDATRAPEALYRHINLAQLDGVENDKSRMEWQKHQASRSFVLAQDGSHTLRYRAECSNIRVEQAIISYLNWVDSELTQCGKQIRYMDTRWRSLILPGKVMRQITARGYLSGEYKLTLDQDRVLNLLIGRELYVDTAIFVRELIQNAIDAVRTRKKMDKQLPHAWKPQINIRTWVDEEGFYWFRIEDNGIGMTEKTIQEYFLKVGHSYYNSTQFQADKIRCNVDPDYTPISRFGIGLLSCFMSDPRQNLVEVTTKHFPESGVRYPAYRLSIQGMNGYYYLASDEKHRTMATEMPDYPKSNQRFISEPGTIIAVRTSLFRSGGSRSFKDIIDDYVVCPEIPIHYEGIEGVFDCKTEQEFMNEVHQLTPEPVDGVYRPIEQIDIPEEDLQRLSQRYPELQWIEKPRIVIYCVPLDYITDDPLVTGATVIAKAEGKAVWNADGLDPRFVPQVELGLSAHSLASENIYHMHMRFELAADVKLELSSIIDPLLQAHYPQPDDSISIYDKLNVVSKLLKDTTDIPFKEFRAFQAVTLGYDLARLHEIFEQHAWFQSLFKIGPTSVFDGFDSNFSINTHNGILTDDSQFLPLGDAIISCSILILHDEFCPNLDLSREKVQSLPLSAMYCLDALADQIQYLLGINHYVYYDMRYYGYKYRFYHESCSIPLRQYLDVINQNLTRARTLHFRTDAGTLCIPDIENKLKTQDKLIVTVHSRPSFHTAALLLHFDLKIMFLGPHTTSVCAMKRALPAASESLLAFPPALFLPPVSSDITVLSGCDESDHSNLPYNSNHPFAQWLIANQAALLHSVPGIYHRLIDRLQSGYQLMERINEILAQLRNIPHLKLKIIEDLTADDFIRDSKDEV